MPWVSAANAPLLTDLYQLTMAQSYLAEGMHHEATFELFVRRLPPERAFLVVAGIEDAIAYLQAFRFDAEALAYLETLGLFDAAFLELLARLRFTGDAWAMPEGEVAFAGEPILRVTAPLIEAQIVETFLLNAVLFQSVIATKAARVAIACAGRPFADFAARRDHGADAALKGARAAFIGGAASTSNVLAGQVYGIPLSGTMAHSYVLSFPDEEAAFRAYARRFGEASVLLIDTYDTLAGARVTARISAEFLARGVRLHGVRLDSGDLEQLAKAVRAILDEAGQHHLRIVASSDLDEHRIADLLARGAPIDSFGVGTQLGTSADAPALGGVYKLVADANGPKAKLATGKETLPGAKQVFRFESGGRFGHDLLGLADEAPAGGRPLLRPVIHAGTRVAAEEPLPTARERAAAAVAALPGDLRALTGPYPAPPVHRSPALTRLAGRER